MYKLINIIILGHLGLEFSIDFYYVTIIIIYIYAINDSSLHLILIYNSLQLSMQKMMVFSIGSITQ